ncbi:MAG: hypothetical protein A2218_09925 [Elusimicrobia bacterium RIFOXYA2_FULL_53_38]|nr:MAG: hypothetical protein A2218_09925 [Elusimicrobia bacterium RIFOXYA2_FULL_53_38]
MSRKLLIFCAIVLVVACGASKNDRLQSKVDEVRKLLDETKRNPMAAGSFSATVASGGGNVISYLKANLPVPEGDAFACYELGKPSKPNCIYITRGSSAGEYIIEGYATDLTKPDATALASVDPRLVPDWDSAGPDYGTQADTSVQAEGLETQAAAPVILSVNPQWIISDSVQKLEITLLGQNLAPDASVISLNPLLRIDRVEPDPVRTSVIAVLAPSAPAGDYMLQYQTPGGINIPFTFRYIKP